MSKTNKAVYTGSLFLVYLCIYWLIQHLVGTTEVDYFTQIDKATPFIPEFVWIYHTLAIGIAMVMIFYIQSRRLFMITFWSCIVSAGVMSVFHILAPAHYPREAFEVTNVHEYLVHATRIIDGASNTFPSAHVAFSVLMYLAVRKTKMALENPFLTRFFLLWAIGISLSTMAIKQHFFADVLSGWATAILSFYFIESLFGKLLLSTSN